MKIILLLLLFSYIYSEEVLPNLLNVSILTFTIEWNSGKITAVAVANKMTMVQLLKLKGSLSDNDWKIYNLTGFFSIVYYDTIL